MWREKNPLTWNSKSACVVSQTYARVVFPDAAAKMVLVNRIIALQAGGVLAQTTPAQLLRGVLAFVQVGNVNLSRNTLGLWVALNMYGVNHCLFDCAWMFQGASGLMVVAAMLWEAGLCGRPPSVRVGPLMVMASNDVASTTVQLPRYIRITLHAFPRVTRKMCVVEPEAVAMVDTGWVPCPRHSTSGCAWR
jgi:hypothetical protein